VWRNLQNAQKAQLPPSGLQVLLQMVLKSAAAPAAAWVCAV
jgi:hypothetical protein